MNYEKQPSLKALILYLSYWRRFPWLTVLSLLFSLSLALQHIVLPLMMAFVLGEYIREHTINTVLLVSAAIIQFSLVGLAYVTDRWGVARLHLNVEQLLYSDAFKYLAYQDYGFFADRFSGSLVTQASKFAKSYTTFNDILFFELIPQLTTVFVTLSIITYYSVVIGLTVFVLWASAISLVVAFGLRRMPLRRAAVAKESQQVGELADVIANAVTVKTFGAEDREIKRYEIINRLRGNYFLRSWHRAIRNVWTVETICVLLLLTVFIGGLLSIEHGSIGIATFLLFQVYLLRIIENIRRSNMIVRQIEVISGDAQEMAELMDESPNIQDSLSSLPAKIKVGTINFNEVTFQYADSRKEKDLFNSFSLSIKPGEKIGLVGPSGGGKTTITRLLLRFMDVQSGAVMIDGQDICNIRQQDLRRAIAYVPQEPLLFHRSIKENISYGNPSASDKEIIEVAKKSFAHDFISILPAGYDTLVGERGVKLSGGQRQRVAIARAMLAGAPILILDEATSALDSESERVIQKALRELMKDKTAVVIAHRLSTIQRMNRIVVLDEGRIVEEGTHKNLIKQKGLYAKLWKHQSGGFIEE